MSDKKHYEAIKDVHVNLENRNHAIDEYGYGPLNPNEPNDKFWNEKAKLWKTTAEEAKKSRCHNCAAFNQTPKIIKAMGDALGPVGDKIVEKSNLGYCEFFYFKCAGDRTCDAWVVNGPLNEFDISKWGMERLTSGKELGSSNIDDRRTEKPDASNLMDTPKTSVSTTNKITDRASDSPGKITDRVPSKAEPLKPMSDFVSRSMNSPQRSERMMPGPYQKTMDRIMAARKARGLDEDAPANAAGTGEIAGLGVGPQGEPGVSVSKQRKNQRENKKGEEKREVELNLFRRQAVVMEEGEKMKTLEGEPVKAFVVEKGKFAGHDTFIVPSDIFHNARNEKKKGKHWTKYIGHDEYGKAIRQHAKMNYSKPIILQDERTGCMCYARYGKEKKLMEAPLLTHIGKKQKINMETGIRTREEHAGEKVARIDKEHDLHHTSNGMTYGDRYMIRHRATGKITGTVSGTRNKKTGTFTIDAADSTGKGPKMHKVYRKILQSGHSTSLVGMSHSPGGQRIWQKLSTERGVSVHGWKGGLKGKPVNLDPKDPEETHITDTEVARDKDKTAKDIYRTKLVASYVKRKTAKR